MQVAEKVTRNIGILRRQLTGKPHSETWSSQGSEAELRERARERMLRGEPLTDEMMLAFTEYPFPGMRMLKFRRVLGGWKMTGGPFGGELGYEYDLSFDDVIAEITGRKSYHQNPGHTISRSKLARLITDEEMANVEYSRLAEDPAIKQNELSHSTIRGIADDEKRHAQQLKDILQLLVREGKIV